MMDHHPVCAKSVNMLKIFMACDGNRIKGQMLRKLVSLGFVYFFNSKIDFSVPLDVASYPDARDQVASCLSFMNVLNFYYSWIKTITMYFPQDWAWYKPCIEAEPSISHDSTGQRMKENKNVVIGM